VAVRVKQITRTIFRGVERWWGIINQPSIPGLRVSVGSKLSIKRVCYANIPLKELGRRAKRVATFWYEPAWVKLAAITLTLFNVARKLGDDVLALTDHIGCRAPYRPTTWNAISSVQKGGGGSGGGVDRELDTGVVNLRCKCSDAR
jgi:hypothetical protein